jgi:hypothetical protein
MNESDVSSKEKPVLDEIKTKTEIKNVIEESLDKKYVDPNKNFVYDKIYWEKKLKWTFANI